MISSSRTAIEGTLQAGVDPLSLGLRVGTFSGLRIKLDRPYGFQRETPMAVQDELVMSLPA
jgi:hypothetical protein